MENKLLPIGTVVLLKGGTKKLMITGYSSKDPDSEKVYDYNGCIFPEGIMQEIYSLFNHNQIDEVFYKGLENNDSHDYIDKVQSLMTSNTPVKGLKNDNEGSSSVTTTKAGRTPKAPTSPRDSSEMMAKFGVEKHSMEGDPRFSSVK